MLGTLWRTGSNKVVVNQGMNVQVAVYLVTYRRHKLLERALRSVIAQRFTSWEVRVVNDDPEDPVPRSVVERLGDPRILMFEPTTKRGPARAFNEVFKADGCEFSALLEDDNWWEPKFLEEMVEGLKRNPDADIACGNEKIWKEMPDGKWEETGRLIWSFEGWRNYETTPEAACGSAKICNSSMVVRRQRRPAYLTPDDIPVDVTEHFRERVIKQPVLLFGGALVNYAETLKTNRSTGGTLWGEYQAMLTASVFASTPPPARNRLARSLFANLGVSASPRATSLISAAFCSRTASSLWRHASRPQKMKFLLGCVKRPLALAKLKTLTVHRGEHWRFLLGSRFNQQIQSARF